MVQRYVVGLPFSANRQAVILMQKKRPAWMAGLFNGAGGKIEAGESPLQAMIREWQEEADCWLIYEGQRETVKPAWRLFITLAYEDAEVHFFAADLPMGATARSRIDEPLQLVQMRTLPDVRLVPNLYFIIPMAQHFLGREEFEPTTLRMYGHGEAASPMKGMLPR